MMKEKTITILCSYKTNQFLYPFFGGGGDSFAEGEAKSAVQFVFLKFLNHEIAYNK